jgi:hypothetical protein
MSNWNNPNNPNNTQNGWKTPSRSSPQGGGTRACLCKDTLKYSRKCCDGTLWAQGIGQITRNPQFTNVKWEDVKMQWVDLTEETWNNL